MRMWLLHGMNPIVGESERDHVLRITAPANVLGARRNEECFCLFLVCAPQAKRTPTTRSSSLGRRSK